jgi:adenosine deaminase
LKKLIVGLDYCGNEQNELHKISDVIPILQKFREEGLMITIHSGESENYQKFDFKLFRPDRISHTYFYKEEEYLEVMKNKIPIEVCPTGSYCVKELNSFNEITLNKYLNKMVMLDSGENYNYNLFCINTDDTMLFNSDLMQEYFEVASNFKMSKKDIKEIILRTIDFIFEKDENFREQLRNNMKNY